MLRTLDEDEDEWRYWKAHRDEEGAIGCVMEKSLKGGYKCTRTEEAEKLSDDFMRESPKR